MSRRLHTLLAAVLSVAVCAAAAGAQEPPAPPLRAIPGLNAPDQFPRGCVDCHVDRPDLKMDTRLSTLMTKMLEKVPPELTEKVRKFTPEELKLQGVHPEVEFKPAETYIPDLCLNCHFRTTLSAPPFSRLIHGLHLVGKEKNHFISLFQGECTHCHKLDQVTGWWSLGSGVETR